MQTNTIFETCCIVTYRHGRPPNKDSFAFGHLKTSHFISYSRDVYPVMITFFVATVRNNYTITDG
jgi:hypothetical protein